MQKKQTKKIFACFYRKTKSILTIVHNDNIKKAKKKFFFRKKLIKNQFSEKNVKFFSIKILLTKLNIFLFKSILISFQIYFNK